MPAKRDPNEEMLMRLSIGNFLMMLQIGYGKSKPRVAKFATLLNRDINLKWDEYMEEIYGPIVVNAKAVSAAPPKLKNK